MKARKELHMRLKEEIVQEHASRFDSKDYIRSRKMYAGYCTFDYFITILVADAFLAKLLTSIGISDSVIGLISSFVTLAFLFQLSSVFLARKLYNTKATVIAFEILSQVLFMSLYLIPFFPFSTEMKTVIVVACVMVAYILKYLVASILYKWANSYVDPHKRGEYSAVKEMISLLSGIVFTLIIGYVVDQYDAVGNINGGFIFISAAMLVLVILNLITLLGIKGEKRVKVRRESEPVSEIIRNTLGNRAFVNVVIMTVLYDVARYIMLGFMGTYKTKELLLSVGAVQIINMIANLARFFISKPFGRFSDKYTFAKGMEFAFVLVTLAVFVNIFTTPQTWWCIVIYTILYNVSVAGTNQNSFNITYSYVKSDYFVAAMAIKNSIGGLFGFGAAILGSKILEAVQANGNMVFGIPMYGQQLLSAISFVIMVITVLFVRFVIGKQKVMIQ